MVTVINFFITIYQDRPVCIQSSSPTMAPMNDLYSALLRARARAGRAVYVCCAFRYGEHAVGCHVGALGVMVVVGDRVYRHRPVCVECSSPFRASAAARASTPGVAPMNDVYSAPLRARVRASRAVYVCCVFRYSEHAIGFCVDMLRIMVSARGRAMFVKSVVLGFDQDSAVAILIIRVRIVVRAGSRHVCDTGGDALRLTRIYLPDEGFH